MMLRVTTLVSIKNVNSSFGVLRLALVLSSQPWQPHIGGFGLVPCRIIRSIGGVYRYHSLVLQLPRRS